MSVVLTVAASVYGIMSAATYVAYALDKSAARRDQSRTPEATLHLLELLGGWPGALVAQRMIRHKNAKVGYQIMFWLIVAIHVAAWVVVLRMS